MNSETVGTLIGLGVFVLLRVIDILLPKSHHLRYVDRWLVKDNEDEEG